MHHWKAKKNTVGTIQLGAGSPTNETLIQPVREYMAHIESLGHSGETVRKRWDCMRHLLLYLEAVKVERVQDVTLKLLEDYRLCLIEHGYSESILESSMRTVKLFYRFLEDKNMVFDNPAHRLQIPKANIMFGTVLTESEVQRMLAVPDLTRPQGIRDRALLETLYSTGIRAGEAVALTVFDADLDRATLRVKGKGRRERLVPLGKHAVKFLGIYLKEARPKLLPKFTAAPDALWLCRFRTLMGKGGIGHAVSQYAKAAGLSKQVNIHAFRRTCATHLLRHGAHPAVVAQLLGHADLSSLSHYLQTTIGDLLKAHAQTKPGR
jgi:integrase/recombinase XerD